MTNTIRMCALLAMAFVAAEGKAQSEWSFGVKAGLNISDEETGTTTGMMSGLHVGGMANVRLNHLFDLEADLMYSQQGVEDKSIYVMDGLGNELSSISLRYHSHYLTLPVTLKVYGNDHCYVELGPQVGYQLSRSMALSGNAPDGPSHTELSGSLLKRLDVAGVVGIGYAFDSGLLLNARYVWGFTDTVKYLYDGQNRNLQFSVGYLF